MKIRDAMVPHTACVGPNDRASAAIAVMKVACVDTLAVLDHRKVSGTVTKEDVLRSTSERRRPAQLLRVDEVMSEHRVRAREDEELAPVEERMKAAGLSVIPVVNDKNHIVGLFHLP